MSFVIKESKHILRDRRTLMILFGMPVVMLLLFGFAISTDVKNVRMVVVSSSIDNETQKVIDRINASEYFTVQYFGKSTRKFKWTCYLSYFDYKLFYCHLHKE